MDEGFDDENSYDQGYNSELIDSSYMADSPVERKEFEKKFWNSIQRLTPEHREVAMMLIDETPYNEMAQTLGCSEDTLRVKVYRTRRVLLQMGIAA